MDYKEERSVLDQSNNLEKMRDDERNFYYLWEIIVKRKIIIIVPLLLSLLMAAIYSFAAPEIYRLEAYVKLYLPPKEMTTVKELLTAQSLSLIVGNIDSEKRAVIFAKTQDEISKAEINQIRGETDKLQITIESRNRDNLPTDLLVMLTYLEDLREIKSNREKILSEIDEKIKNVKEADKRSDFQIRELEKRLNSTKVLPVGFNPVDINQKSIDLKMEKYRLEQECRNYKALQLLQDPFISKYPVKPKKAMIITLASIVGLMFGILIAFITEYFEGARKRTQYR
jgi:LPS O-antigen subunit length determinant protein (WzzB/FepE family)